MHNAELIKEPGVRKTTIDVLAEFFQDSLKEDPTGVGDWLVQGGTSPDLFVELVAALRSEPVPNGEH